MFVSEGAGIWLIAEENSLVKSSEIVSETNRRPLTVRNNPAIGRSMLVPIPNTLPVAWRTSEPPIKVTRMPAESASGPNLLLFSDEAVTNVRTGNTHGDKVDNTPATKASSKLILVAVISISFMVGEQENALWEYQLHTALWSDTNHNLCEGLHKVHRQF